MRKITARLVGQSARKATTRGAIIRSTRDSIFSVPGDGVQLITVAGLPTRLSAPGGPPE